MTTPSTSAPVAHADKANRLASEIGDLMRRIRYLTRAAVDASDGVDTPEEKCRNAMDSMLVFMEMVGESAAKAEGLAERVALLAGRFDLAKEVM